MCVMRARASSAPLLVSPQVFGARHHSSSGHLELLCHVDCVMDMMDRLRDGEPSSALGRLYTALHRLTFSTRRASARPCAAHSH